MSHIGYGIGLVPFVGAAVCVSRLSLARSGAGAERPRLPVQSSRGAGAHAARGLTAGGRSRLGVAWLLSSQLLSYILKKYHY